MTGRELLLGITLKLQDQLEADDIGLDIVLTIPQLYALKAEFERQFYEAYYDPKTPCPHTGTKWRLEDSVDRCGQCGRRITELVTEDK
jgi:hypothetical protein